MYYIVTVGYELETLDKEGNPKLKKVPYLVQAESVEEASLVIANYAAEDMRSSEVLSIVKGRIEEVISEELTPKYYKNSKVKSAVH